MPTPETIKLNIEPTILQGYRNRIEAINASIESSSDPFEVLFQRGRGLAVQAEFLRQYVNRIGRDSAYVWQGLRIIHDHLAVVGLDPNPIHVVNHALVDIDAQVQAESSPSSGYGVVRKGSLDSLVQLQAAYRQVRIELSAQPAYRRVS